MSKILLTPKEIYENISDLVLEESEAREEFMNFLYALEDTKENDTVQRKHVLAGLKLSALKLKSASDALFSEVENLS